jgi:flagellar basal-body rod modification protein FlgD
MSIEGTSPYATLDADAFMKMFITQMKHQDPTNPMNPSEMLGQLSQLTTVQKMTAMSSGMEKLAASFGEAMRSEHLNLARGLIGHQVAYHRGEELHTGLVTGAAEHDGRIGVIIDGDLITLNDVVEIGQQ